MTNRLLAWLLAVLLPCAACGTDTPTGPSRNSGSRTGTWTGTVSDPANGTGVLRVVLEERPLDAERSLLNGTWTATFGDAARNSGGTLAGTVTGPTASFLLTPARPPTCATPPSPFVVLGSYITVRLSVAANDIRGEYLFAACDGVVPGTLDQRR